MLQLFSLVEFINLALTNHRLEPLYGLHLCNPNPNQDGKDDAAGSKRSVNTVISLGKDIIIKLKKIEFHFETILYRGLFKANGPANSIEAISFSALASRKWCSAGYF